MPSATQKADAWHLGQVHNNGERWKLQDGNLDSGKLCPKLQEWGTLWRYVSFFIVNRVRLDFIRLDMCFHPDEFFG